ncbi:MAG TPA: peptidase C39 family protein [Candidatus Baltobacteraceae bacterium]|jgi:hypothetical protein|nr:peptidase C39 family protein [Candidatus Baltobacteraceae bacterium]
MLTLFERPAAGARIVLPAMCEAIVSWNTTAERVRIDLVVELADGRRSRRLPYVEVGAERRTSLSGGDAVARIEVDVLRACAPITALELHADAPLEIVAVSTPPSALTPKSSVETPLLPTIELDVPTRSQYHAEAPDERGWCSPATLAMLLAADGLDLDVPTVARGIFDEAYGGTGNWTFATAFAANRGRFSSVAHLADLSSAGRLIAAGIPLALSIAWQSGELPGAPLECSAGHLVVLRGFDAHGDPIVNDPARHHVRSIYPRVAFEHSWIGHGGIVYFTAARIRAHEIADLINE